MQRKEWNFTHGYRDQWPPGEWSDEPDKVQWQDTATGLPCLIVRNMALGNLNGYVGVPRGHPYFGRQRNEVDCRVHGGITWAALSDDPSLDAYCQIFIEPDPDEPTEYWWFGFDTGHSDDLAPSTLIEPGMAHLIKRLGQTYRNMAYIRENCERLAMQLQHGEAPK